MSVEERTSRVEKITQSDYEYLNLLRGASIIRVMLVHLGLSWFFPPYSYYIGILFPLLFFISGAVSYTSFNKSLSIKQHLKKRIIETLIPYYVFSALVIFLSFLLGSNYVSSAQQILGWITITPNLKEIEIPIDQIWFIKTLLLIHIISSFIFKASDKFRIFLVLSFIASLSLTLANEILPIRQSINSFEITKLLGSHAIWSSLTLLAYYLAGAIFYTSDFSFRKNRALTFLVFFTLTYLGLHTSNYNFDFEHHASRITFFYISSALCVIMLLFIFQTKISKIIQKIRPLNDILIFSNNNSYAIFLLHTVVLFFIERFLQWQDLSGNYILALARLLLVVVITIAIAPYFTKITKSVIHLLIKI